MKNSSKKFKLIQQKNFTICKRIIVLLCITSIQCSYCAVINDDFVDATLDKSLQIKPYKQNFVTDSFAESNTRKSLPNIIEQPQEVLPSVENGNYKANMFVYKENRTPVKIKITKNYSTKDKIEEGTYLEFETVSDVNNYKAGTKVSGRIETISPSGIWGTPADVIISNFKLEDKLLQGIIEKSGSNRTLWVRPLSIVGGIVFGSGIFFMFIKGGHAKIKTDEIFTVYF